MGQVERKTKGWANFKGKSEMIFQELKIFDWPIMSGSRETNVYLLNPKNLACVNQCLHNQSGSMVGFQM